MVQWYFVVHIPVGLIIMHFTDKKDSLWALTRLEQTINNNLNIIFSSLLDSDWLKSVPINP